jgi:predicted ABC-type ATPase
LSQTQAERPTLWIVAGPNGSGKSTAFNNTTIGSFSSSVWIINPDVLSKRILEQERLVPDDANLQAVRRIGAWLEASVDAYQTVAVETVLSTDKYRKLVEAAQQRGFEIALIYVLLATPDHCVRRVKLRAKKGGHDVPEDKIRARYLRSLVQLPWFLERANRAFIYDNSGKSPRLIAQKIDGAYTLSTDPLDAIAEAIATASGQRAEGG